MYCVIKVLVPHSFTQKIPILPILYESFFVLRLSVPV